MGRRFSARVENGAHRHGEVWQEGGGCGVAAAENTVLGTRFLRVFRAFAVKVQPRIHREAAKSAKISRRKTLSCQQRIFGLVVQGAQSQPQKSHRRGGEVRSSGFSLLRAQGRLKVEFQTSHK